MTPSFRQHFICESILLFFLIYSGAMQAQVIKEKEWDKLITALSACNWDEANTLAGKYLDAYPKGDSGRESSRLRYMYIYSLAGKVGERSIERDAALKKVKKLEGRRIEMPGHPVHPTDSCMFNCIWYSERDSSRRTTLYSCSSNCNGTFIHAFETYHLQTPTDLTSHPGHMLTLSGVLDHIELRGMMLSAFGMELKEVSCLWEGE